jgi:dTDP-4-amino-4,6-dideoxygalactose transaminase
VTRIPFNSPYATGNEFAYLREAIDGQHLSGNGPFSARCAEWLRERTGARAAFLTHSATGALEMAALLADLGPGDEVIMPSFTFVSTANAVVLRGATPVFCEIDPDTFNLDPRAAADAMTERTRMLLPIHYAGVGADLDALAGLARDRGLLLVEDAAQGIMASRAGRPLGSVGHAGALSFHETKNVTCGEGGALLVNDPEWVERAEIVHEKGTNRARFFRGQVDKYTWVDLGSSFLMSDMAAAFLWAQLEHGERITDERRRIWRRYHAALEPLEAEGRLRRPVVPDDAVHNAHLYHLLLPDGRERDRFIERLAAAEIATVFHYVPLHSSPAGRRFGRAVGDLRITTSVAERLVRLPLWVGMTDADIDRVVAAIHSALSARRSAVHAS